MPASLPFPAIVSTIALAALAALAAPAVALAASPATPKRPAPDASDLRPALKALKAGKAADGLQTVHTFDDGSRLAVELAGGKAVAWHLLPARGTPEGLINFDRAPNPKDKKQCGLLLARGAFTTEYTIDCAFAPPLR